MPTVPGVTGQNPYDDILRQQEEAAGPTVIPDQDLGQGFRTSNVPQAPGVIVNPYDRMFEEGRKRTEVMARMTALDTSGKDPEQYAEWIKLGQDIGLPVQAVENDPEHAKQIQRLNQWAKMAKESPQVAAWMAVADNGVLAQDDIEVLSSMEKLRRGANDLAIAAPAGLAKSLIGPGVSGFGDLYDGLTVAMTDTLRAAGAPDIVTGGEGFRPIRVDEEYWWANPANWFRALGDPVTRAGAEAIPEERQNYATDVVGGLSQLVGQIILYRLNPAAATAVNASAGAEQQGTRAEQAGATEQEKAAAVFLGAGITAAVERFGVDMILERVPPQVRDRTLRWIVDRTLAGGIEGGQEAVEAVANNIVARSIYDPEAGLFDGAGDNAAVGFGVGFIARAIFGARMRDMEAGQAKSEQTSVDALVDLASQSTLRQRAPDKFQDLMTRLSGEADANYHVDAQEFNKLYQSKGLNPETVAAEMGVDVDAYRIATISEGELLIPLGTYLAKVDKADHAKLSPFGKLTAGGLTPAEAEIDDDTIARQADLIRAGIRADVAGDNRIRDDVVGMVVNRYDRDTAEKYGTVMQAAMRSMAERAGVDPWTLYSRYRLKVKNELPGMQNARPVDTLLDPLIERLRAGDIPTEGQARGPTLAEFLAEQGGINDEAMAGEIRSIAESDRATRRGQRRLVRDDAKYTLDGALEAAVEAGYLPEGADLNDLLAALTDEVVTERPTYALQNEDARVLGDRMNLLALDEELSRRGIDLSKASNEDIKRALSEDAARKVEGVYDQSVFHGSPHRGIEREGFKLQAIGTGEGAQAYGWGLYFAGKREIAEWYRKGLSHRDMVQKFRDAMPDRADTDEALEWANSADAQPQMAAVIKALAGDDWLGFDYPSQALNALFSSPENYDISPELSRAAAAMQGQLYAAEIPDDGDLLDWDAPLSEQPEKVRAILGPAMEDRGGKWDKETGKAIYRKIAAEGFGDTAERHRHASEYLLSIGIPGLRYLDGTSRGAGDGSRNYVIWDEGAIQDVRTFYQSPDAGADTENRGAFYYRKNDGGATIQLNPKADASTFIHESAHFFLEVMGDLVKNNEASPEMQADFRTLLTWAGTDADKWFGMSIDQRRDAHERVARGFEAYVREGKAPSADLAGPFERFRGWLLAIYRSLTQLNVELSDEVRGVFDRMLATDAEIQRTEAGNDYAPLFREAAAAGIPQEQFQSYVDLMGEASREARDALAARAVRDVYREREAWWKEEAAGVRAEVEAEVNRSPLYRAWYYMAFGTQPDGSPLPEGMERAKLDRDWLIAQYGHEWVKKHLLRKRVYAVDGGGDPDLLAAGFGFDSGDAMIQALANAQPRKAYIESEVSRRMQEKHGDLVSDDGQLAEAAQKAAHNSKRLQAIEAEMAMLARLAGQPKGTTSQIRRVAESMVARMKLRDINPNAYLRAERKNARLAQDFFAKGDFVKALDAKRKQALNAHLYDVTLKAKEEGEKIRDYVKRFEKVKLRERLGKVGRLNEVDALLEAYDLRRVSGREIDRRKAQGQLLKAINDGLLIAPRAIVERMKVDGTRTNYRELTMENLRGLRDVLRQMEKEARNEYEALLYGEKIDLDQKAEEMAAAILANNKPVAPKLGQEAPAEAVRRYGKQALNAWLRPAAIARLLDGSDNGPMTRLIIQPIRDAVARVLEPMKVKAAQDLADLYSKHYTTAEMSAMNERTVVPGLNTSLSRWDVISLAMNWGNAENREALLRSQVAGMQPFTQAGLEQAIGTLTARDWAFVQDSWDYLDSYWPQIKAAQERRRGIAPPKVEALPFEIQTADGQTATLRGGYYPLRYNPNLDARVRQDEIDMTFDQMIAGTMSAVQTKHAHNQARVGSGGKPVTLGMNVMHQHVNNVIQDLALGDVVMMVDKLLKRQQVRDALIQTGNMDTLEVMRLWLKDVATGELAARTGFEKSAQFVRRNFTLSKIGFNVVTALLGVAGVFQSIPVVGSRFMAEGAKDYGKNPRQAIAQVMDQSDFMRLRYEIGAFNKDIADFRKAMQDAGPIAKSGGLLNGMIVALQKSQMPPAFADMAFFMIRGIQMQVDTVTWLGGYHRAKAQNMPHAEAVRYADGVVENAQTSGLFPDRSGIERGTFSDTTRQAEFVKLFTVLGSVMFAKGNIAYESYKRTDFRSPAQVAGFMGDIVLLTVPEVIWLAILRGAWPEEDEQWWWWLTRSAGEQALGTIPIVRELPSAFKGFGAGGGPFGTLINDVAKVVEQTSQAEVDAALLKSYVNMIGTLTGAPSIQTNRAIDAAWREHVEGEDVNSIEYILGKRQNAQ